MAIKLVLVDDHPLVLGGLEQLLRAEPDFEVLATCGTVEAAWNAGVVIVAGALLGINNTVYTELAMGVSDSPRPVARHCP